MPQQTAAKPPLSEEGKVIDPRASSAESLETKAPLPLISRRALNRIKHPAAIPSACNCCGVSGVELVDNSEIYNGKSYGEWSYAYLCRSCGAYVGLHPGTDIPLGTLADKPLRDDRQKGKAVFNQLWRDYMSRNQAYAWLAEAMRVDPKDCHFGLFDSEQCLQARILCTQYIKSRA